MLNILTYVGNALLLTIAFIAVHFAIKFIIFVVKKIVEVLHLKQIGRVCYYAVPAIAAAIAYTADVDVAIALTIAAVFCYILRFVRK